MRQKGTASTITATRATTKSIICLSTLCQEASGVVRKTSTGWPWKSSKLVWEIWVLKKSATSQTSMPSSSQVRMALSTCLEIIMPGIEDDAVDGMFVEQVGEFFARSGC